MRIGLVLISVILIGFACKKQNSIDALAFPSERLDAYTFEYGTGEVQIDEKYHLEEGDYTLLSLDSYDESTGETFKIYAVYIGEIDSIASDSIILYCHGQSKHNDNYWSRASLIANTGQKHKYGVLMMDYRGFGMSEGSSDEAGLSEDVDACITWLKDQGADPNKTFYYGYSLGAIPAIERIAHRDDFTPNKLIIESPLASVNYLAHNSTIINVESKFVMNLEFENAEVIKEVEIPLLWMHGIEDTYVAIPNGELIYANHGGTYKEAIRVEDCDHAEVPMKIGFENYLMFIENFLNN